MLGEVDMSRKGSRPKAGERFLSKEFRNSQDRISAEINAHYDALVLICHKLTGSESKGEDLAHDVFAKILTAPGAFEGRSKLTTYIYQVAANLNKNQGRADSIRKTLHLSEELSSAQVFPLE